MLQVQNLSKRYGEKTAVNDVSFTVPDGKVTGFLGPNGAGKSTTMRMIVGLDRPTAGTALVDGSQYTSLKSPLGSVGAHQNTVPSHPGKQLTQRSVLQKATAANNNKVIGSLRHLTHQVRRNQYQPDPRKPGA